MAKPKAVRVVWRDSALYRGWQSYDGCTPTLIESIGWLVEDTKDKLVIATSYDDNEDRGWAGLMVIPRECVVSKKVVKL